MQDLKIATVAPIAKNTLNKELTYFTSQEVAPGTLVAVSIKNRDILGIVTSVRQAQEIKSDIKISDFGFKKIKKIVAHNVYLPSFLLASEEAANYFVSSTGQILKALTPKSILSEWQKADVDWTKASTPIESPNRRFEISILGLPDDERYSFYKSLIREEFARKHSIFFVLPTIHDVEECGEMLKKGIEEYTAILHSRLSAKNIVGRWRAALGEEHPILIVTTPAFLSLPRSDVATIIVDKENSQFYKTMSHPYIDVRAFAEMLAKQQSARLVLGDSIPRIEDIYNAEAGNFIQESPLRYRFPTEITETVIDTRKEGILSAEVKQAIADTVNRKERVLAIAARKGLGSSVICSDCGSLIDCPNCSAPMTIISGKTGKSREPTFFCDKCGRSSSSDAICPNCKSWKLKILGITTETVENEIKSFLPSAKVFRIDSNAVKNYKQAKIVIDEFMRTPGGILVGTEMVLNYLNQNIETVAVISIDTLFSLPDFGTNENIFNLLMRLRFRASKKFIVQTRRPEEEVLEHVLAGDLLSFYRNEIKERKRFNYPPFKIIIKITAEGPEKTANEEMAQLEKFLQNYEPEKFDAFIRKINNKKRINIILRIDPERWPDKTTHPTKSEQAGNSMPFANLIEILRSLPQRFTVRVSPDNIL